MKRDPADPKQVTALVEAIRNDEEVVAEALDTVSAASASRRANITALAKLVGAAKAGELLGQHRQSIYRAMSLAKQD